MVQINKNLTKYICFVCIAVLLVCLIPSRASALTVPSLYGDMTGSSTQLQNLANYATRYDSFFNSKYVAFRDSQNSYYLVWGESDAFTTGNNQVTCADCEFVRYYRPTSSSDWEYVYTENDSLSLNAGYLVTTNLDGIKGFNSELIDEWNFRHNTRNVLVFYGVLLVFCSLLVSVRRE